MIALSGCIGKTYHLLLANPLTTFLTANQFIDPTLQKELFQGIIGCIEHTIVMDEVIKDVKKNRKTLCHITFFDLEDTFGSAPHCLNDPTLLAPPYLLPPIVDRARGLG